MFSLRKTQPPAPPRLFLPRPRLRETVLLNPDAARWLVTAPAGFGKTTLLAELAREAEREDAAVIWLSFDEQSDAQETIAFLVERASSAGLDNHPGRQTSSWTNLLAALNSRSRPVWIFLDDVDRAAPGVLSVVTALLESAPHACRLVIAGRPPLRVHFAKPLAIGELWVLGTHDLRFLPSEVAALRKEALGAGEQAPDNLSDGWPIAAALAAWVRDPADTLAPGSRLFNFIGQEVVAALTAAECDALGRCSLIDELSRADVEALVGDREGHAAFCAALVKLEGLVRTEAGARASYRVNPAIAVYFRLRLFETAGEEARRTIADAATRLAETGRPAEAVMLARDAHDTALLQSLLNRQKAVDLWGSSGLEDIRRLPELAGEHLRASEPQLLMMGALIDYKEGRIPQAEKQLRAAAEAWPPDQPREELVLVALGLTVYGCRPFDRTVRDQLAVLLEPDRMPQRWLTVALSAACLLHLQYGDLAQATKMAVAGMNKKKLYNLPYGELFLHYHMAAIAAAQGDTKRARDLLRNGRLISRTQFAGDKGADTVATVYSAELDYERGRLPTARTRVRLIEGRFHHMEAWFDIYAAAFETSARLLHQDLGLLAVGEHLTVNAACLRERELDSVACHLDALHILMRAQAGLNGQGDDQPLTPPCAEAWDQMGWRARETVSLARAAVLLLNADVISADRELERLIAFAQETGVRRMELRALLLVCEVAEAAGNLERATGAFETAIQIGLATGFRRSFLDYCGPAGLERLAIMADSQSPAARLARSILQGGDSAQAGADVRLTRREQEVLQAIEFGGSDKIIARRLGVSEHAIRFHLKNIFQKLKAHNRAEAVQIGRRLGALNLIEPIASDGVMV